VKSRWLHPATQRSRGCGVASQATATGTDHALDVVLDAKIQKVHSPVPRRQYDCTVAGGLVLGHKYCE